MIKYKNTGKFEEWVKKHQIVDSRGHEYGGDWIGEGWIPVIDRLATDMIALGWDRVLSQVKEKFGGLRFYIYSADKLLQDRIAKAEEEAAHTCDNCGAPSKIRSIKGWYTTLCQQCEKTAERW